MQRLGRLASSFLLQPTSNLRAQRVPHNLLTFGLLICFFFLQMEKVLLRPELGVHSPQWPQANVASAPPGPATPITFFPCQSASFIFSLIKPSINQGTLRLCNQFFKKE